MAPLDPGFRAAIAALERAAGEHLAAGDLDAALRTVFDGAGPIWESTQAAGCICGSEALDAACLRIGGLVATAFPRSEYRSPRAHRRYVYAVSELYRHGGHTRVLEDLVAAHPHDDHHVVWVRGEIQAAFDDVAGVLRARGVTEIHRLHGEPVATLGAAFGLLARLDPDVLVHLGHPHDPITLALMQKSSAGRLVMVHIADCSFALGRTLPHAAHVSLGRHFERFARDACGLESAYLPLSCPDPFANGAVRAPAERAFVTATSGSAHKFDVRRSPSYLDVLRERFAAREGTHVHFGPLLPEQLRAIDELLDAPGRRERFVHVPHVPLLSAAMIEAGVTVYLDSYPVGGARAIVEAMAAGLPICAASHDPNLDGASFCYPEALTWRTPDELGPLLAKLDGATLASHAALSRAFFEREHAFPAFVSRLDDIVADRAGRPGAAAGEFRAG